MKKRFCKICDTSLKGYSGGRRYCNCHQPILKIGEPKYKDEPKLLIKTCAICEAEFETYWRRDWCEVCIEKEFLVQPRTMLHNQIKAILDNILFTEP